MGKVIEKINRWRHTRGYGVHSPFGYELVTRAVRPVGCAWYGYSDIERTLGEDFNHSVRDQARMLLRLTSMLNPGSVFLQQGCHPAYYTALKAADSRIRIIRLPRRAVECEMICTDADYLPLETLLDFISRPSHWIIVRNIPSGWSDALFDSLPEGLMFDGPKNTFVINRPGMQKIRYSMDIG